MQLFFLFNEPSYLLKDFYLDMLYFVSIRRTEMTIILNGAEISKKISNDLKLSIDQLSLKNITPKLGIIRVGNKSDDIAYQQSIVNKCKKVGIQTQIFDFDENISMGDFSKKFYGINEMTDIHGILVLRPLPDQIDTETIGIMIKSEKDIDGMKINNHLFNPCTPQAVVEILKHYKIELEGSDTVIINRTEVVGRPLAMMLLNEKSTITIAHSKTKNLKEKTKAADIVVSAIGKPNFLDESYFNKNSVIIDVGINECSEGRLCGDIYYDAVKENVQAITPVPGGVGTVTTMILLKHVIDACLWQTNVIQ